VPNAARVVISVPAERQPISSSTFRQDRLGRVWLLSRNGCAFGCENNTLFARASERS
jgi:hypothetical protein